MFLDFLDSFCYIHGTETLAWNIEGAGPKSNKVCRVGIDHRIERRSKTKTNCLLVLSLF